MLGDLFGSALVAGTESATRSDSGSGPSEHATAPTATQDYRLLIRAIKLGDTVESVWQMIPGLTWEQDERTGRLTLTDGRGLIILALADRVYAIRVSFMLRMTLKELADEAAAHLSIPSDATWVEESPDSGFWVHGDELFIVSLTDGSASVALAIESVVHEVVDLEAKALGSAPTSNEPGLGSGLTDPNYLVEYQHGAKILVQHFPRKNETTVYHYIPSKDDEHKGPPFRPDLTVSEQTIKGTHVFELFGSVHFSGRRPSAIPTDTSLLWIHKIVSAEEWHFPPKSKLIMRVDDNQFEVDVHSQTELRKDNPSDAEFNEVLITKPTYQMYLKIANAKNVTVQIGTASFNLDPESIASYRDFVGYLTPGKEK